MKKPIGVYTLTNNMSIQVFDLEYGIDDKVLAGTSFETADWYVIHYDFDEFDNDNTHFKYGEMEISLQEIIKF